MKNNIFLSVLVVLFSVFITGRFNISSHAQSSKDPVIIIPGTAASWNYKMMLGKGKDQWRFFPGVHNYDSLIKYFKDHGYEENKTLYTFFYDWRQYNQNTANQLKDFIATAKQNSGASKVDLIAHSMGGLVARSYIQGNNYQNDVDQLIMIGTPNQGSSDVYPLWGGGEVPRNWDTGYRLGINTYLWYLSKSWSSFKHYAVIREKIPSVGELLPVYPYLKDYQTNDFTFKEPDNVLLYGLNTYSGLFEKLANRAQVTTIASRGENTVNAIPVKDSSDTAPRWEHGKPEPNPPAKNDGEGDNRVLLSSAHLPDPIVPVHTPRSFWQSLLAWLGFPQSIQAQSSDEYFNEVTFDNIGHGDLPHGSINAVSNLLGITKIIDPIPSQTIAKSLTVLAGSPIDITITDPNGHVISKTINQISNAEYDDDGEIDGKKMIVIPEPLDGNYFIKLTGVANGGSYDIGALLLNDEQEANQTVSGTIQPNQTQTLKLTINGQDTKIDLQPPPPPTPVKICKQINFLGRVINVCYWVKK